MRKKTGGSSRPNLHLSCSSACCAKYACFSSRNCSNAGFTLLRSKKSEWRRLGARILQQRWAGVMQTIRRPSSMSWLFVIMDVLEACKCKWQQALQNRKAKPKRQMQSQGKAFCTEHSRCSALASMPQRKTATPPPTADTAKRSCLCSCRGRHCMSHQLPVLLRSNELEQRLSRPCHLRGTTRLFVKCCNCV